MNFQKIFYRGLNVSFCRICYISRLHLTYILVGDNSPEGNVYVSATAPTEYYIFVGFYAAKFAGDTWGISKVVTLFPYQVFRHIIKSGLTAISAFKTHIGCISSTTTQIHPVRLRLHASQAGVQNIKLLIRITL